MNEEYPDLLADDGDHDQSRSRSPFPAMSERFRLSEELANAKYQNNLLGQKCRELEKERDEARREVCGFHHLTGFLSGDYAISRGWDCYKNYSGEGFPQSVKDFKEFLKASSEEDRKTIERLQEENRQLRELKMQSELDKISEKLDADTFNEMFRQTDGE